MFGYELISSKELQELREFKKELPYLVDRFGSDGPAICSWGAVKPTAKEWADAVYHAGCDMADHDLKCHIYKSQPNKYVLLYIYNPSLGKFLVLEKNRPAEQKGKINLIGGKVNPDEAYKAAAFRECYEETGIVVDNFTLEGYIKGKDFVSNGDKTFCIAVYSTYTYDENINPIEGETEKPFWMSYDELMRLPPEKHLAHLKTTVSEIVWRNMQNRQSLPFITLEDESVL